MGIFPACHSAELLEKLLGSVCGKNRDDPKITNKQQIKGCVVLMKKNVMDVTDVKASFLDRVHELFSKGVSFQLVAHSENERKLGREEYLEDWVTKLTSLNAEDEATFDVMFEWDESDGPPGAVIVRNHHHTQFYLKTVALYEVPGHGPVAFHCDSWVYPVRRYNYDRVFFTNNAYLPRNTPDSLLCYRQQELNNLRGEGLGSSPFKEWDRAYDYAYYNDLGHDQDRPVLGGSDQYPYPRRQKTGRRPTCRDPKSESRLFLLNLNIYVPRDEKFSQVKFSDFMSYSLKSLAQVLIQEFKSLFDKTINEFDSFQDILNLYEGGVKVPDNPATVQKIRDCVPWEFIRELARSDGEKILNFPIPDVLKEDKTAWRTDEEFGREMLAGVNPVIIRLLQEFPPKSKLDVQVYGNQDSSITKHQIEENMEGLTVDQAIRDKKLFILDHHDALMPFLSKINTTTTKTYATRTVLLLKDDDTLKPLAIELSLPREDGGAASEVYTPCEDGIGSSIWQLAKAYAAVNDSGYHQLISHWLNTHAVIEPFIIATNRQMSVLHPIHKLLKPHFRDTLNINALARHILINSGGVLERTVFPAKFAMGMSSAVYRNWNLMEQALPNDLIKRGIAVPDENEPHGLCLLIKDYPFAVDGLEIWAAIEAWVRDYCSFYYPTDDMIQGDTELQSWWKEVRETGHGDLKDQPWWPKMQTRAELIDSCTIIIWVASALHAAVNFGQYPYAGYLPNRPTVSRRFMPKPGTPEYTELETDPEVAFLKTITAQFQTLLGVSLIEILSRHSTDEIYLGQRERADWTADGEAQEVFKRFHTSLVEIETRIMDRNNDTSLKNRSGPVKLPYTLLYPNTSDDSKVGGLTGKGIPNSISI